LTALIDLTLLSTPSRTRGIGRYAADLACAVQDHVQAIGTLRVRAIERFGWTGPASIADDLRLAVASIAADSRRFSHAEWAYRVRLRLASITRRSGADVLHSPHPDATPIGPVGCPRIVTCHDLISMRLPERYATWRDGWRWGRRRLDARRYRSADHIIAVSHATAADLVSLLGIPHGKITVVHHGVDTSRFSPEASASDRATQERWGVAQRPYLLSVGAADWRKNGDGMLAALQIVRRKVDVTLAWAGRIDAGDLAALRAHAGARNLADALLVLGYVPDEDLAALMRGATTLLFVSRLEGFGYPAIEAMACACPVIASNRGAIAEMAGEGALLVDPERPKAIAEAILTLAGSPQERQRVADRGVARSHTFSLREMAVRTADVYRRIGAGRRP
jgi:glycosyltransferase involved in cell wall biosynthesis